MTALGFAVRRASLVKPLPPIKVTSGLAFRWQSSKKQVAEDPHGEAAVILGPNKGTIVATQSGLFKLALPLAHKSPEGSTEAAATKQGVLFLLHARQPLSHLAQRVEEEVALEDGKIVKATFHGVDEDPRNANRYEGQASKWASSTEIAEFVQDAAKDTRFFIQLAISNSDTEKPAMRQLEIKVPTFAERTFYLRRRLLSVSEEMRGLLDIKKECDKLAQQGARRMAVAGLGGFALYWFGVWYLTFRVYGWDVMEPVTYLTGLTTIAGGYVFFLLRDKEVSYRSVIELSHKTRREKLYDEKGFDRERWSDLIDEGAKLRRAIKAIADDYDVKWNLNDEAGPHRDVEDELETDEERMKRTERDMRRKAQKRVHKEKGRDD